MPTAEEITRHFDDDPDGIQWVGVDPPPQPINVVDPDPAWPAQFEVLAARLRSALGDRALDVEEPSWHEHRLVVADDPLANIHVFGVDSPEVIRHRMLRDWLSEHPDDRERCSGPTVCCEHRNRTATGASRTNAEPLGGMR